MPLELTLNIVIGYSEIWDDEQDIATLLEGIPSDAALQITVHYLTQMHTREREDGIQLYFLNQWLQNQNQTLKDKFNEVIHKYSKNDRTVNFINNISSLYLINHILKNKNNLPERNLTRDEELRLLKSYLLCSDEWTSKSHNLIGKQEYKNEEDLIGLYLPSQLPVHEIKLFKDFRLQYLKAIRFFEFCENDEIFSKGLEEFLASHGVDDWQLYLFRIIELYIRDIKPPYTASVLENAPDEIKTFLDSLSINDNMDKIEEVDFLSLRQFPIYKLSNGSYLFINLNFFIDKIYEGVQFRFYTSLTKETKKKIFKINDFGDFRNLLGSKFSEQVLFSEIAAKLFKSVKVHIPEIQISSHIDCRPDYYIRNNSKIFVFEYKDLLINKETKHSYNLDTIIESIHNKLVENERGEPKGITQLFNNIQKIRNGALSEYDDTDFINSKYYPIIVVTDISFQQLGINYIIIKNFREILDKSELPNKHLIKDPVIIVLDDLIKFEDLFSRKKIKLNSMIDNYLSFINTNDIWQNIASFHEFIHLLGIKYKSTGPLTLFSKFDELINYVNKTHNKAFRADG